MRTGKVKLIFLILAMSGGALAWVAQAPVSTITADGAPVYIDPAEETEFPFEAQVTPGARYGVSLSPNDLQLAFIYVLGASDVINDYSSRVGFTGEANETVRIVVFTGINYDLLLQLRLRALE